jgi:F-type H+-transporting ATPase subunit b
MEFVSQQISTGVIFWTLIIFVTLLIVLKKLAWKPVLNMLHDREARIRDSLQKADNAKSESERLLAEQKALVAKQREEAAEFLKRARVDAEKVAAEMVEKARREADDQVARAKMQIDEERKRAVDSVRSQAVNLALAAAGHLLSKTLDQESHQNLVRDFIQNLPQNLPKQ